jgi:hypothetical protein
MNTGEFDREYKYQATMALAKTLLARGLITAGELADFRARMLAKYQPQIGAFLQPEPEPTA